MHGQQFIGQLSALLIFLMGLAGAAEASGERLVLPFSCQTDGTAVRLKPSGLQELPIVGSRQERVVLACAKGGSAECRTMIAHKFDVNCSGQRVAWDRVAEAMGGRRTSRVWRSGNQLNIALVNVRDVGQPSAKPCGPETEPARGGVVEKIAFEPCQGGSGGLHFVMPAGYAPVAHFGARIVSGAGGKHRVPAALTPVKQRVAAAPASKSPASMKRGQALERTVLSEPLPDVAASSLLHGGAGEGMAAPRAPKGDDPTAGSAPAPGGDAKADGFAKLRLPPAAISELINGSLGKSAGEKAAGDGGAGKTETELAWSATVVRSAGGPQDMPILLQQPGSKPFLSWSHITIWLMLTALIGTSGWLAWSRADALAAAAHAVRRSSRGMPLRLPQAGRVWGLAGQLTAATSERVSALSTNVVRSIKTRLRSSPDLVSGATGYPAEGLEQIYGNVAAVVGSVSQELPLRRVLDDELKRVGQRLSVARAAAEGSADAAQVPLSAFRVLNRDLDRIRRIAESARESVDGEAAGVRMPSSRDEAFEVLGLNPNVDSATIKKFVDALRMSWHPDLAHDAADLALRAERIKQINVAMELISGKRV